MTKEFGCSFAVVADVQYAGINNGYNFARTCKRYYRNSLILLDNAVAEWKNPENHISFALQLGDLIDGLNSKYGSSCVALDRTLKSLDAYGGPVYHIMGNHDFYNFDRRYMANSKMNSATQDGVTGSGRTGCFYYHFSPSPGFRIVVLDTYDESMLGWPADSSIYQNAKAILTSFNHNKDLNSMTGLTHPRFVKFNGGLSTVQKEWLEETLTMADTQGERVIVSGHVPIYCKVSDPVCLVWNAEDVLSILQKHISVVAYFAGHTHSEAYAEDDHGIHHVTFPGIIQMLPGSDAFCAAHLFNDRLELSGNHFFRHTPMYFRSQQDM